MLDNQRTCIDLKQGLREVESNLTHQHERFRAECVRAQENGIRLIVLVEEKGVCSIDDVAGWKNPRRTRWERIHQEHSFGRKLHIKIAARPPVSGDVMAKQMRAMTERYNVEWAFCAKQETGRTICGLQGGMENLTFAWDYGQKSPCGNAESATHDSPERRAKRGNSSTGRAPAFQAGRYGFKSRLPLHSAAVAQSAEQPSCNRQVRGSTPRGGSSGRVAPPVLLSGEAV